MTGSRFRDFFLSTLLTCSFSLTKTYDYERYGVPFRKGKHWYYSYNEGLRAQAVYYSVEGNAIDTREKGKVFFDPSTLSDDGTLAVWPFFVALFPYTQLNTHAWSKDGTLYAYALSQSGSDWCHAKIRKVETGEDYPEKIEWLKFTGLNFTHDNKGFFYQRLPEPVGVKDAGTETGANRDAMVNSTTGIFLTNSHIITFLGPHSLRTSWSTQIS
jgi:prolyl oligopeptidase